MHPRVKFKCERVRQNNGIVEVFFTKDGGIQDEHVLINTIAEPERYERGKEYWITIEPAFPHPG
jgi:hypothetical protein